MHSAFKPGHLIFLITMIICFVLYYKYSTSKTDRVWGELKKEYPALSFESELNGVVSRIVQPDPNIFRSVPDRVLVIINDSLKRRLRAGDELRNKKSVLDDGTGRPMLLGEALAEGDRVVKKSNSDVLSVYKVKNSDTVRYDFELTDDLGYSLMTKEKD
jgi:hypothetical protein